MFLLTLAVHLFHHVHHVHAQQRQVHNDQGRGCGERSFEEVIRDSENMVDRRR
jgi:hypothetical protein